MLDITQLFFFFSFLLFSFHGETKTQEITGIAQGYAAIYTVRLGPELKSSDTEFNVWSITLNVP